MAVLHFNLSYLVSRRCCCLFDIVYREFLLSHLILVHLPVDMADAAKASSCKKAKDALQRLSELRRGLIHYTDAQYGTANEPLFVMRTIVDGIVSVICFHYLYIYIYIIYIYMSSKIFFSVLVVTLSPFLSFCIFRFS